MISSPSHDDGNKNDQFNAAMNAIRQNNRTERHISESKLALYYKPMIRNALASNLTVEDRASISALNSQYKLHSLLKKISEYKDNIHLLEDTQQISIADAIELNNDLTMCENRIHEFLEEIKAAEKDLSKSIKGLDNSYQKLVDAIEITIESIHEEYRVLIEDAERLIPLS